MFEELRCKTCGGVLHKDESGYVCASCGARFQYSDTRVNVKLESAYEKLRAGDFDEAQDMFSAIILEDKNNFEAYFGRFLAYHGIIFVDDIIEGKKVPTCNNIREESVFDNSDYKTAVEKAPNSIKKAYIEQAKKIEKNRLEWIEKASKEPPYDVFICFKDSDREHGVEHTLDSVEALKLHSFLTSKGYRVFLSSVSLKDKVAEEYEPYIYNALKTAQVMVVYGQKADYINSTWVKNEWSRFALMIKEGKKQPNSLVIVYENFDVNDLPTALKRRQCLDASQKTFYSDLLWHIEKVIELSKEKEKIKIEKIKIQPQSFTPIASVVDKDTIEVKNFKLSNLNEGYAVISSLALVSEYIKGGLFSDAKILNDSILLQDANNYQALYNELLIANQASKFDDLGDRIISKSIKLIDRILNNCPKEFGESLIDKLYMVAAQLCKNQKTSNESVMLTKTIIPYKSPNRTKNINVLFNVAIESMNEQLFNVLLLTIDNNDVNRYVGVLEQFANELLENGKFNESNRCFSKILGVSPSSTFSYRGLIKCDICDNTSSEKTYYNGKMSQLDIETVKKLLATMSHNKMNFEIKQLLFAFIQNENNSSIEAYKKFVEIIKFYPDELQDLDEIIKKYAELMRSSKHFEECIYLLSLAKNYGFWDIDAQWNMMLAKSKASTAGDMAFAETPITEIPEFAELITSKKTDPHMKAQLIRIVKVQNAWRKISHLKDETSERLKKIEEEIKRTEKEFD
mgnify:CR=1 FL=1